MKSNNTINPTPSYLLSQWSDGKLAALGRHGAAKAALDSVCRYFAVALAKRGITVKGVSPGRLPPLPPAVG